MKKISLIIFVLVIVLVGCSSDADTTEQTTRPVIIEVEASKIDTIQDITVLFGEVVPERVIDYYAVDPSAVKEILVVPGEFVSIGDILFRQESGTEVESTISGYIGAIYGTDGELVINRPVLSVIDKKSLYIETMISSELKKQLTYNTQVMIQFKDEKIAGSIYSIDEVPDARTKLFKVRIDFQNYDAVVGEYSEVSFVVSEYEALLIPLESVIRKGELTYIYLVDKTLVLTNVHLGLTKGEWIEVVDPEPPIKDLPIVVKGQNSITNTELFLINE
jgi:multidrug efflux pump subunit AcrA (membrane-fusion protein)